MRVLEHRTHSALPVEPRKGRRIRRKRLGDHLDGDVLLEIGVSRTIHLAHAAGADVRHDLIAPDARSPGKSASVSYSR